MYTLAALDLINPDGLKPFNEKFELQLPKTYLKYDYNSKVCFSLGLVVENDIK